MGLEDNKAVVRRHLQRISDGDPKGAAELWAPRSFNHGREVSREGLQAIMESLIELNEKFEVKEMVAEGDWVACRAIVTGKHTSRPKLPVNHGVPLIAEPRGKSYTVQHIHLFKVVKGKIVGHWANRDDLDGAIQLGLELTPAKK